LAVVVNLLEVMFHDEGDKLTEEDHHAFAASREYFRHYPLPSRHHGVH
jgi:hypothetical protein